MSYIVKITDKRYPIGPYLQGPRTPQHVRRDGYGFTTDIGHAWTFAADGDARRKATVVNRHMGWGNVCVATNASDHPTAS
jgi:hypothetical protein